jgi:hypothetical protein
MLDVLALEPLCQPYALNFINKQLTMSVYFS